MLKGIDENGNLRNVQVTEKGEVKVSQTNETVVTSSIIANTDNQPVPIKVMSGIPTSFEVNNTNAIPVSGTVNVGNVSAIDVNVSNSSAIPVSGTVTVGNVNAIPVEVNIAETTLLANVATIGTTATTLSVNKKVTEISIANYSETATLTVGVDLVNFVIGSNMAIDLPINKNVTSISLTASATDTVVQYVVKGEN